jgi:serine phosphatase RsbU (regulator of sigma subunit)
LSGAPQKTTGEIARSRVDVPLHTGRIRPNYLLPGTGQVKQEVSLGLRLFRFLRDTWAGRAIALAFVLAATETALGVNIPLPWRATFVVLVILYGTLPAYRLARRLFYRVRAKLLMAYFLTAIVPLIIGVIFTLLSWSFLLLAFSTRLVTTEMERQEAALAAAASAAVGLASSSGIAKSEIDAAILGAAPQPTVAWSVVRNGTVLTSRGDVPTTAPSWVENDRFSGLVRDGQRRAVRAVARRGTTVAVLELPYDEALFASMEAQSGITITNLSAALSTGRTPRVRVTRSDTSANLGAATHDQFDWETGARSSVAIMFNIQPWKLYDSLTPGRERVTTILLFALGVIAFVFACMYLVALLFGGALVRSITGAVHALSVGTLKLQGGDFSHRIIVRSKDQLGDLAQSFNSMSQGIEELLEQQGEKERLEEDLRVARNIQMSLLPQEYVEVEGLKIAAVCLPANEMGGDYYDLLPLSEHRLGVLIADVSGKGTSAALYMAELKGLILSLSRNHDSPKFLLSELNEILAPNLDRRSFVTMTYAILDSKKRTIRVARAGHNPLIHFDGRTGETRLLSPPGLALGFDAGETFRNIIQEIEMPLVPGDSFVFFTDGISEAMNGRAELFGESRLADVLREASGLSSDDLKERILHEVRTFAAGESPHDDMTLVIVKVV